MDKEWFEEKENEDNQEIDLLMLCRNFIRGCIRFWWVLLVFALLGGVFTCAKTFITYTPTYCAKATFTLATGSSNDLSTIYSFNYNASTANQLGLTFPYILSSPLLTEAMEEDLGVEQLNGSVSAEVVPKSNLITMYAYSENAEDAKNILESALHVYPNIARFVIGNIDFHMIDNPETPTVPYNKPDYARKTAKGLLIGLLFGFVAMILYAIKHKTIHSKDELNEAVNLPCLATIPWMKQKRHKKQTTEFSLEVNLENNAFFEENIKKLKFRIENMLNEQQKKVLMVTSTVAGEGKSLIATNLAYQLASNKKKVLLIDADLRKQDLANKIDIVGNRGIDSIISGQCGVVEAMVYDKKHGIFYLGGNTPLKNTSHILSHDLKNIINAVRPYVDYIILDTPPCGNMEDVYLMGEYVDSVLYVVRNDKAEKNRVFDAIATMEQECNAPISGYVFNGESGILGEYGYGRYGKYGKYGKYNQYGYGYGKQSKIANQD